MTTTPTPEKIGTVVDQILAALREQGKDPNAESVLEDFATGKASETVSTPAPVSVPKPKLEKITRPNGQVYHTRNLIGDITDVDALRRARDSKMPVLLYGPPGTGKTAMIEAAYAPADCEEPECLYTVQGSGDTEVADFIGGYVQLAGGEFKWVDGPLLLAMAANGGRGCALFIDEVALIDPKVMSVVYGVMDGRDELVVTQNPERGIVKAGPEFYVSAACNPNAPGARMSEALLSRFTVQFEVISDYKLARSLGVNSKMTNAAANLARKMETDETSWAPQLRELLAFKQAEEIFGTDFAIANLMACAPEIDRPTVADVIKRAYGIATAVPLRLG